MHRLADPDAVCDKQIRAPLKILVSRTCRQNLAVDSGNSQCLMFTLSHPPRRRRQAAIAPKSGNRDASRV